MATTLYISGFGSTPKPYIPTLLAERWGEDSIYYVLQNVFSQDVAALDAICRSIPQPIRVIGHSTGGFLGLYLFTLHPNIAELHLINPAIDLLWSFEGNPLVADFLKERKMMETAFARITDQRRFPRFPLWVYQGKHDDRVHIDFNRVFTEKVSGHIQFYEMGHRFDEQELSSLLDDIAKKGAASAPGENSPFKQV